MAAVEPSVREEKVAHVLAAGQTRVHHCHWPGCTVEVPPAKWGCRSHWFKLPAELRARIWDTYTIGQEISGRPSAAYLAAARDVQAWIERHLDAAGIALTLFEV